MSVLVFRNPFSTRFVQPGAIPWFATDTTLRSLLCRLYDVGNRAIICGPHGSGKSTMLSHLASVTQRQGHKVHCLRICSWLDAIRIMRVFVAINPKQSFVFVDSWELLGFFGWFLCQLADFRGICVVVTVHEIPWWNNWPVLLHTKANNETFRRLVHELMTQYAGPETIEFSRAMLKDVFQRHSGNLREAFFELYDHYERNSRITLSAK